MNGLQSGANAMYAYNLIDFQDLCRVCGNPSHNLNSLFDDHGCSYDFSSKINVYLPITVRLHCFYPQSMLDANLNYSFRFLFFFFLQVQKTDYLPQKICSSCANTLLSFHQLYTVCQSANSRFLAMLEFDTGYEQHLTKQNDPSELLELQSSLSREIENEILHMNDPKDIINEIESEIAANAAVKVLERIGSSENISLVGEVIEPTEAVPEATKKNGMTEIVGRETKPPKSRSPSKQKKGGKAEKAVDASLRGKARKSIDTEGVKTKNFKEKNNKLNSPNGAKKSKITEVLKENGCQRITASADNKVNFVVY